MRRYWPLVALTALLAHMACAGEPGERVPTDISGATIRTSVSTSGDSIDPDGYTVTLDDSVSKNVSVNGSTSFTGLAQGEHIIQLSGVADNCRVTTQNPQSVFVTPGGVFPVSFSVACGEERSRLEISVESTGQNIDSDGYTVTVDDSISRGFSANDSTVVADLQAGEHTVELTGVAGNCSVADSNPRTVSVAAGASARVSFSVSCVARTGAVTVSVSTSGEDVDPDGYSVTVADTLSDSLAIDDSTTFTDLPEGQYSVELVGVADNCSVDGDNPRTVEVSFGDTVATSFSVGCVTRTGDLQVSSSTTGENQDDNGYSVTVDDSVSLSIGINDSVTFSELKEGDHEVSLSNVASNCRVDGANPRTVTVAFGEQVSTTFNVECRGQTGDLRIAASTEGDTLDRDGYVATVDGSRTDSLGSNGSVTFSSLAAGEYEVELSDVQANCTPDGDNPRTVRVLAKDTVTVSFTVQCEPALFNRIVFQTDRDGRENLYALAPDRSTLDQITQRTPEDRLPAVSPHGTRIAFTSPPHAGNDEVYVMRLTNTRPVQITDDNAFDGAPAWSPDGKRLVFYSRRDGDANLYLIEPDGTNLTQVTSHPSEDVDPTWHPDGGSLVFASDRDGDMELYRINTDGSGLVQLTDNDVDDDQPTVSPDGDRIAFRRRSGGGAGTGELWVMNADGTELTRLTENEAEDARPAWSPDGRWIAFESDRDGDFEVYRMSPNGSEVVKLTVDPSRDGAPAWSPFRKDR